MISGKTDFFELPEEGSSAIYGSSIDHTPEIQKQVDWLDERACNTHTECIEIEHSDEYRRGYEDGVESFRPKFEDIMKQINAPKNCDTCRWKGKVETFEQLYCDEILAFVPKKFGCILYKAEEDF